MTFDFGMCWVMSLGLALSWRWWCKITKKLRRVVFWIWQPFTKPCDTLGQEEVKEAQKEDVGKEPENGDGAADPKGAEDDSKTAESQAVEVWSDLSYFECIFFAFQRLKCCFFSPYFHQEICHATWKNFCRLQPRNQRLETRLVSQIGFRIGEDKEDVAAISPIFDFHHSCLSDILVYSLVLHISTDVCRPLPPPPQGQVFQTWHDRMIFTNDIPYHRVYVHGLRVSLSSTKRIPHAHHIPCSFHCPRLRRNFISSVLGKNHLPPYYCAHKANQGAWLYIIQEPSWNKASPIPFLDNILHKSIQQLSDELQSLKGNFLTVLYSKIAVHMGSA